MGSVQSTNIIDTRINAMISVLNSSTQECSPIVSSSQILSVSSNRCPGKKIDIKNIKMTAKHKMDVNCAAMATQSMDTKISIAQEAKQMAEAISQSLSLNPSSTDAKNIATLSLNLGATIHNISAQTIRPTINVLQKIELDDNCSDINVTGIDLKSFSKIYAKAIKEDKQVNKAIIDLKQTVEQIAKAKQENALWALLFIFIILGGAFFLVTNFATTGVKSVASGVKSVASGIGSGVSSVATGVATGVGAVASSIATV